jgi:hypothetical protein
VHKEKKNINDAEAKTKMLGAARRDGGGYC